MELLSPTNNTSISNKLFIDLKITDENLPEKDKISFLLPSGERIVDKMTYSFNTTLVEDGEYEINIFGIDKVGNSITRDIMFTVDHTIVEKPTIPEQLEFNHVLILLAVVIAAAILAGIIFARRKRTIVNNQ